MVGCSVVDRGVVGPNHAGGTSLQNFANSIYWVPHFDSQCLSEETLKAVGPFYL